MKKIIYFINPSANENAAKRQWQVVRKHIRHLPENPIDITKIENISGFISKENADQIVIAGGDGTLHLVAQAILPLKNKPILSILPLGFGNALAYCLEVDTYAKAAKALEKGKTKTIDIFKTTIPEFPIGILTMGVGFDARIVYSRMNHRYIGLRSYILSAMRSIIEHENKTITITIDRTVTIRGLASTLAITNAPIIGRNYVIAEHAKLDDGLLDGILFSSRFAYLANLRVRGFKHPLYSEENKIYFTAKHLKISGENFAQVDGDPAYCTEPIEVEVVPKAITFSSNV